MRLIDIYKQTAGGIVYITGGCIQTGEPTLQRTPIVKTYTMADGSPVVYPSAKDTCTAEVELECTRTQAAAIEQLVSGAHIIFAGLKLGALLGFDLQKSTDFPVQTGTPCIINGAAEIGEKYARSGIYFVSIPVQLKVTSAGVPQSLPVPTVRVSLLTVDGVTDGLGSFTVHKLPWNGETVPFLVRERYFTKNDSLTVGYVAAGEAAVCYLYADRTIIEDTTDAEHSFTVPLHVGNNEIVLEWLGASCRPMRLRLDVFRQNVG